MPPTERQGGIFISKFNSARLVQKCAGLLLYPNLPRTWRKTVTAKGKRPRKKRMEERIPMKREDLKAFNLSDEDVQKIMDLHGADIEKQRAVGLREVVQPGFELAWFFSLFGELTKKFLSQRPIYQAFTQR